MKTTNDWKILNIDGNPQCNGDTIFIGINEVGFCGCFNQIDIRNNIFRCWYETPEENYYVMSYLKYWKVVEFPSE